MLPDKLRIYISIKKGKSKIEKIVGDGKPFDIFTETEKEILMAGPEELYFRYTPYKRILDFGRVFLDKNSRTIVYQKEK